MHFDDHDEDSDNIFDEDDALDYIMQQEVEQESIAEQGKGGCLGLILLVVLPAPLLLTILKHIQ